MHSSISSSDIRISSNAFLKVYKAELLDTAPLDRMVQVPTWKFEKQLRRILASLEGTFSSRYEHLLEYYTVKYLHHWSADQKVDFYKDYYSCSLFSL